MPKMIAWTLDGPGSHDAFVRQERERTHAPPGWVWIAVEAFGLNRSELFSRRGMSSPDFSFPRVLGLECVGHIVDPSDTNLTRGQRVMALMGGMGRGYDGSYATHTLVPRAQVFDATSELSAVALGALPETYNTAWGVCVENLQLTGDDVVLVRGGTSALGMAAADIATDLGCTVVATTRNPDKLALLAERGSAAHVILDGPDFAARVNATVGPVTAVVECVGAPATIETSAATMTAGGRIGLVGQLAETWDSGVQPRIPASVTPGFTRSDLIASPRDDARMARILEMVHAGRLRPNVHQVFDFEDVGEAHRVMEDNEAVGKLVVVVDHDQLLS